jgi:hypothetical protein
MQRAQLDTGLSARIVARRSLYYREGASDALDRPRHVRAASGAAWIGDKLALIQDDANFIALVDPQSGLAEAIALPAGPGGKRLFDDTRGSKHLKLDLEACFSLRRGDTNELFALGSGSKPLRERIVLLRWLAGHAGASHPPELRVVDASSLYRSLHDAVAFSGSELNLEGAVLRGDSLLLFQRGNGAPRDPLLPINAVAQLSWPAFERYLTSRGAGEVPALTSITQYDLGTAAHVPYTFTDATLAADGRVVFLASAEDSSSAVTDGTIHGTYVGILEHDGSARVAPLLDEAGQASRAKAEGIALDPRDPSRAWAVVDMDDPALASELLELTLTQAP